jgi:hypothetical protein
MKKQLLLILIVLCSFRAGAQTAALGQTSWWALKYSTQYSSMWVRAFDTLINPTAGSGYFIWVKGSNAGVTDIPGIQIKPIGRTNGYWRRSYTGPFCVDWMGVSNSSSQHTWSYYGYTQQKLDSMFGGALGSGYINVNNYPDASAIRAAFKLMETKGYQKVYFSPGTTYYTTAIDSIKLPTIIGSIGSELSQYFIEGNDAFITELSGQTYGTWWRNPLNQTTAATWVQGSFVIQNFRFSGRSSDNSECAIDIAACNPAVIRNIGLRFFTNGIVMRWCQNSRLENCESYFCFGTAFKETRGFWSGAGFDACASNQSGMYNMRVFPGNKTYCAYYFEGVSNFRGENLTCDYNSSGGFRFGIIVDYADSSAPTNTNCKGGVLDGLHMESSFDSSGVMLWGLATVYDVRNMKFIYDCNAIDLRSRQSSTPKILISNITAITSGCKFKNVMQTAGSHCWAFYNCQLPVAGLTTPTAVNGAAMWTNTAPTIARIKLDALTP